MKEDVIYVISLAACIAFGPFYRKFEGKETRKWVGTIFGVTIAYTVSGMHVLHPLICTIINVFIITKLSWRISHVVSFVFSFFYLLFFFRLSEYYGLPDPPGHTNLIMMILILKMSGLAFEINAAHYAPEDDVCGENSPALKKISCMDVVHYALSFTAILAGPYYRYRTYWDWLNRPFSDKIDHWKATKTKLSEAAMCCIIFLVADYFYPAKYANTEEFANRSLVFKLFFIYPTLLSLRMRLFTGMKLAESICSMSGLGAYPTLSEPIPGLGPKNYKIVEELSKNPDSIKKEDLDLETVHNMKIWVLETCYTTRTSMKVWNGCIQYWLATNVYKKFPIKPLKTLVTFTVSSLWHGWAPGYYIAMCQTVIYLPSEDLFVKYYHRMEQGTSQAKRWYLGLWFGRLTCLSYLGLSFQLRSFWHCVNYYINVHWIGQIMALICYIIARLIKPYYLPKEEKQESKVEKKKE